MRLREGWIGMVGREAGKGARTGEKWSGKSGRSARGGGVRERGERMCRVRRGKRKEGRLERGGGVRRREE